MDLKSNLNNIKDKILKLKEINTQLIAENEELTNKVLEFSSDNDKNENKIKELEDKNVNLQFSKSVNNIDKEKLNSVIEELIEELDKGLELLKS